MHLVAHLIPHVHKLAILLPSQKEKRRIAERVLHILTLLFLTFPFCVCVCARGLIAVLGVNHLTDQWLVGYTIISKASPACARGI